jgi:hypothetical protein
MIVVVEDALSEVVIRKIVELTRPDLPIFQVMGRKGHGYIRTRIRELNRTAMSVPVFVVIDLDRPEPCAADLIRTFLPIPFAPRLLFRVAVMEIESWVMADREALAQFLDVSVRHLPETPDEIADPKAEIVSLARRSGSRQLRDDLVPNAGDTRRVGPAYNARLIEFVENAWRLDVARTVSPSLNKAVERLRTAF